MKVILVGHPGSQHIVPASKYLTSKYLPGFDVIYLNYEGEINFWSKYIAEYLITLEDENIIFALDDYFLSAPINMDIYNKGLKQMGSNNVVCVKLCKSSQQEHLEYPVTTQYCIWNREFLMSLLLHTTTPWDFEMRGSRLFDYLNYPQVILETCLDYPVHSCLSSRWEGIRTEGNNIDDIKYLKENGYL